jgi:RNA-binding protein
MEILNKKQKTALKAQAQHLKPIVIIGAKGLTENIILETERALLAHELIKVRISGMDRKTRLDNAEQLAEACAATLIQTIGHIAVFYRENNEANETE